MHDDSKSIAESCLGFIKSVQEFINGCVVVLFANSINANNHLIFADVVVELLHAGKLRPKVIDSKEFKGANDNFHSEKRISRSDGIFNMVEDCHLSLHRDWTVFIEYHTKDVTVLDDCAKFRDVALTDLEKYLLKQVFVVDKFVSKVKFWLKIFPNVVVFAVAELEKNLFLNFLVEILSTGSILSQIVDSNVAVLCASIFVDMEFVFFLRVVNIVVIGKSN